jgi:ABC-2 type transport system ATP-binding protein
VAVVASLAVKELSRSYGEHEALRDLELRIEPGECVAVIGHNGSGKTTAVRLIAGLLEPSAGVVEVMGARMHGDDGGDRARADEAHRARAAVAVVPDTPSLYPDLTVGEHLELVAIAHGVAGDDLDERIDGVLERLELAGRRDARPGELSRGMRQKLPLGCALIRPYELLVLDEPVVGLDPPAQRMLRELLITVKRGGTAVLLTTHQLEFARGIADRAVLLSEGVVVIDGPYDEVVDGTVVREYGLL